MCVAKTWVLRKAIRFLHFWDLRCNIVPKLLFLAVRGVPHMPPSVGTLDRHASVGRTMCPKVGTISCTCPLFGVTTSSTPTKAGHYNQKVRRQRMVTGEPRGCFRIVLGCLEPNTWELAVLLQFCFVL